MSICSMRYMVNTVGINLGWFTRMSICSMRYMVNTVSINLGWFTRMSICSMRYMVAVLICGRRPMVKMMGKQRISPYTASLPEKTI